MTFDKNIITDDMIESISLNMFRVGAKNNNFKILKLLPTNVDSVMDELGLTKVPVNNHFNELEKCNLLRRDKGTGTVHRAEMTGVFISCVDEIEDYVKANVLTMLKNMVIK
jgi:predicted transcriptional regulator